MQAARQPRLCCCLIVAGLLPLVAGRAAQAQVPVILYVDGDQGTPGGSGLSWATAKKYLADAIAYAASQLPSDLNRFEIWVAAAADPYRPDRSAANEQGTRDRGASFVLHNFVALYGGFLGADHPTIPGGETARNQRNPEVNETVLSGSQPPAPPPGACGSGGSCFSGPHPPGCSDVTCCTAVCAVSPSCCASSWDSACATLAGELCGTCGDPGSCYQPHGTPGCDDPACCALVCNDPQFDICCTLPWDTLCVLGAATLCGGDAFHVVRGHSVNRTARLDGFTVTGGVADGSGDNAFGGGIFLTSGGLDPPDDQDPLVVRCKITGNRSVGGGGTYAVDDATGQGIFPIFIDCTVIDNEADNDGGGALVGVKAGGTWVNCLFAGNTAGDDGGAMYLLGNKAVVVTNCTLADNVGGGDGGGVFVDQVANGPHIVTLDNVILWDNSDSGPQDATSQISVLMGTGGSVTVGYSDIQGTGFPPAGVTDGGNNIHDDPRFVNPASGIYRLDKLCSPCIDVGSNGSVPPDDFDVDDDNDLTEPTPDLDVMDRVQQSFPDGAPLVVDMGAYEFVTVTCPWDCGGTPDGAVDIVDFLALLGQWGVACGSCDTGTGGPGVDTVEFLGLLQHWGPSCESGGTIPQTVQDCMQDYSFDAQVLAECICKVEPCTQGCPPENCQ